MSSPVSRALAQGPRRRYLLGYVTGIVRNNGDTILLTKAGHWSSGWPRTKADDYHVWSTKAAAMDVARRADSAEFPAYVRPYSYETSNPANAKGLPLLETAEAAEFASAEAESHAAGRGFTL